MYGKNVKLSYTYTDSFITIVNTDDFCSDVSNDIEKWFDTSAYSKDINRPLQKGINKNVFGKFKDELAGQIITEFCALRAKCYSYKLDNDNEEKKTKGIKQCVIKRQLTFDNYLDALFNDKKIKRSQYVFRSYFHQVYTEKVTKIALSGNNDKRIQTNDKITTYPYGYFDKDNVGSEILRNNPKLLIEEAHAIRNTSKNTRDELEILRKESQALRNNSKLLREEAYAIRNSNSQKIPGNLEILGNSSTLLREEACAIRKKSNDTRNESKLLGEEAQALIINSKLLRKETQALRNARNLTKMINEKIPGKLDICHSTNESKLLREEAQALRNNSTLLIEEAHAIRKTSNTIRNELKILKKEAYAIRNNSRKYYISLNRRERYGNVKKNYANTEKEIELIKKDIKIHKKCHNSSIYTISSIKRDNYYNKKNLKYHTKVKCNTKKEIGCIKNNNNYHKKKINFNKIISINHHTKKEIDKLLIRLCDISERLIYTNSLLNLYRKKAYANKVKIVWDCHNILIMKIYLNNNKNQLELLSKEIHSTKNNPASVKVDKFIRLQKNYVLLDLDMEMLLKKFQYEQFLSHNLLVNRLNANKIKLISPNKKIKSTINTDKNGISANFRKRSNFCRYYTEISMNVISIIIENVYSEIVPLLKKIINKISYT